ncbi:uncharacterized protein BDZ83DRAFT_320697 [Colletotrichum acutatum]|uniref:HhH-GPD domain-containing protein n=1 Tax=Glomerella acutata TaxID=27357 RepID=A0AAD8UKD1_GLOAC|nr:uncharacterized protein BDZ83DRAFT_320697 [Colletotrichum acutatum]KAK1724833.1 hypothetical protein BDZ83DRAFT_320697 [Colletotrichum acutatum]
MTTRSQAESNNDHEAADTGTKRKASEASQANHAQDDEPDTKKSKTENPKATVDWLLSDEAFSLAFPSLPQGHGEIDWDEGQHRKDPPPESAGKKTNTSKSSKDKDNDDSHENEDDKGPRLTYPDSTLTPFQNLVAALLLSKPISHRLGLRTINTLLNPPFGLRTPQDLDEAGFEGRRKVMWEARTQHKEKTAVQLGDLVEGVRKICCGGGGDEKEDREKETKEEEDEVDVEKMIALKKMVEKVLTDGIKGVGPTGAGIFLRRVQEEWKEVFPYADQRALEASVEFGVIHEGDSAKELADVVDGNRGKFVRMLDVLVGIQLEKKMEEALKMARGGDKLDH